MKINRTGKRTLTSLSLVTLLLLISSCGDGAVSEPQEPTTHKIPLLDNSNGRVIPNPTPSTSPTSAPTTTASPTHTSSSAASDCGLERGTYISAGCATSNVVGWCSEHSGTSYEITALFYSDKFSEASAKSYCAGVNGKWTGNERLLDF